MRTFLGVGSHVTNPLSAGQKEDIRGILQMPAETAEASVSAGTGSAADYDKVLELGRDAAMAVVFDMTVEDPLTSEVTRMPAHNTLYPVNNAIMPRWSSTGRELADSPDSEWFLLLCRGYSARSWVVYAYKDGALLVEFSTPVDRAENMADSNSTPGPDQVNWLEYDCVGQTPAGYMNVLAMPNLLGRFVPHTGRVFALFDPLYFTNRHRPIEDVIAHDYPTAPAFSTSGYGEIRAFTDVLGNDFLVCYRLDRLSGLTVTNSYGGTLCLRSGNPRASSMTLDFSSSTFDVVDVSGNRAVTSLDGSYCTVGAVKAVDCPALTTLVLEGADVTTLDVSKCPELTTLNLLSCTSITGIAGLQDCRKLDTLTLSGCALSSVALPELPLLDTLNCYNGPAVEDLTPCSALTTVDLRNAGIGSLDLRGCRLIEDLQADDNDMSGVTWPTVPVRGLNTISTLGNTDIYLRRCGLTAAQLDNVFANLPVSKDPLLYTLTIYVAQNPSSGDSSGTSGCTPEIAEALGWTVDTSTA